MQNTLSTQKGSHSIIIIILVVIIALAIGFFIQKKKTPSIDTGVQVVTDVNVDEMMVQQYTHQGTLDDVSGGSSSGVAKAIFDNTYKLLVEFENLPPLSSDFFYEGWIVNKNPLKFDVISTGALIEKNGALINTYMSQNDLTDHDFYVLTLEPDDGDPAPAEHILEGTLSTK
jgi:hypothetical protein